MALENTKTDFHRFLVTFDVESGLQELPEHLLHQTNIKTFNEDEDPFARCIEIQYSTSVSQLQSEGNLYYRAPFGLNGRDCYLQKR
jgi:hypothetical protein